MLDTTEAALLAIPNGAAAAYGSVIRTTENPRDIEYRVFEKVTSALELALVPGAHFTQRIQAVHDNRALWQALACDLADDNNAFPQDLRARLVSLAIWVTRESSLVNDDDAPLRAMIDVNRCIMQGLRPVARDAA
jgi:flagellar protein FlaF